MPMVRSGLRKNSPANEVLRLEVLAYKLRIQSPLLPHSLNKILAEPRNRPRLVSIARMIA